MRYDEACVIGEFGPLVVLGIRIGGSNNVRSKIIAGTLDDACDYVIEARVHMSKLGAVRVKKDLIL